MIIDMLRISFLANPSVECKGILETKLGVDTSLQSIGLLFHFQDYHVKPFFIFYSTEV